MLRDWRQGCFASVLALFAAMAVAPNAAMAADGKKVFNKCKACHTVKEGGKNRVGPALFGIVGRKSASVAGYKYSKAMQGWGGTWTEDNLKTYLENPRKFIKGNKMAFPGLKKPEQIDAVIAFIKAGGK